MLASELARSLEISEAAVSRWLSGERTPRLPMMFELEALLGWSVGRQLDAIQSENYGSELRERMEKRDARIEIPTVRGVPGIGAGGIGMPALEGEQGSGAEVPGGEGSGESTVVDSPGTA